MVSRRWLLKNVRPGEMPVDMNGIPVALRNASAVVRNYREAEDLVKFYGSPDYCPPKGYGVVIMVPRMKPVYVDTNGERTAESLRDRVCAVWNDLFGEIKADPDEGRFMMSDFPYMSHAEQLKKLELNGIARVLRDPKNPVMNPERQPWQERTIRSIG